MGLFELFLISVSLAMDAFTVAVCKGLNMKQVNYRHGFIVALFFGGFQAGMPIIGWFIGNYFRIAITSFDHWISFVLLFIVGANMIREALLEEEEASVCMNSLDIKELLMLSIATSIDALAIGITLSFLTVDIRLAASMIGVITFILAFLGVGIGNFLGKRFQKWAEIFGGIVLIFIGFRILLEHLGALAF